MGAARRAIARPKTRTILLGAAFLAAVAVFVTQWNEFDWQGAALVLATQAVVLGVRLVLRRPRQELPAPSAWPPERPFDSR